MYFIHGLRIIAIFFFALIHGFAAISENVLIDKQGNPSAELLDVLKALDVHHDGTWHSIRNETQKKWFNKGQERWEFAEREDPFFEDTYGLFSTLYMVQNIYPEKQNYDYGVILGACVQRVRDRFWFLKEEWEKGVRFNSLVVLTGDRPLAEVLENEKTLLDPSFSSYPFRKDWQFDGHFPKNETEMTQLVFDQLDLPSEWREMEVVFVDTPRPKNARRPNTADTFVFWMDMHPEAGTVLCISSQPFVGRQDLIARKYVAKGFQIDSAGHGFTLAEYEKEPKGFAVLTDELARWIYELVEID